MVIFLEYILIKLTGHYFEYELNILNFVIALFMLFNPEKMFSKK